ncbi:PIN/TRAM domain-containing protein [Anaeroglobus geminatus]|jgi:Integral membrane protein (PIN domain superfamily)|uniref:PIN domain protein n=1 Tax=Anaeroglobus geminatus F0357 TaxID=861450 RepID=G9YJN2_9FIRM|nr:TRAM domain-containing protein [Anaeroglobus geminatus]EHM38431.1 PIN domain protein [Anaeroglobus geminatus F0357]
MTDYGTSSRDDREAGKARRAKVHKLADTVMRWLIVLVVAIIFVVLADELMSAPFFSAEIEGEAAAKGLYSITVLTVIAYVAGAFVGAIVGYILSHFILRLIWAAIHRIEFSLSGLSGQDLLAGTIGLLIGLIIANLIGLAFARLPIIGAYGPIVFNLVFGYAGMSIAVRKKTEISALLSSFRFGKQSKDKTVKKDVGPVGKLLDTSSIIDGRIAELCATGFLEGPLLVPVFVLEELQLIADSSDLLKRTKGRRGLDILKQMQEDRHVQVDIISDDFEDAQGVDSKLIRLGRQLGAKVITNDYNLNKVAELQGVIVLNINDLANAMKPARVPGEEMNVLIVKAGKEENQGIAYLDDGTMIVVENGEKYIGMNIPVTVTSVLQTSAGRMIFVKVSD